MRAREHILRSTTLGACAALAVVLLGAAPVLAAQPAASVHSGVAAVGGDQVVIGVGSQGRPMRAAWMAEMAPMP